jgi:hypothetical protein
MKENNSSIDQMTKEILQKQEWLDVSDDFTLEIMKKISQESKIEAIKISAFKKYLDYLKDFKGMIVILLSLSGIFAVFVQNFKSYYDYSGGFLHYFAPLTRYFDHPVVKITILSFIILLFADIILKKAFNHKPFSENFTVTR